MNLILYSEGEGFKDGAKNLAAEATQNNKPSEAIEVEHFVNVLEESQQSGVSPLRIHFLTSDYRAPDFARLAKQRGHDVINGDFLLNDMTTSKFDLLRRAYSSGVRVPHHITVADGNMDTLCDFKLPAFLKSKSPRGLVRHFTTRQELVTALQNIPQSERKNFYLESDISRVECPEIKAYYVNGNVHFSDESKVAVPPWLSDIMGRISTSAGLEAFSADFIIDWVNKEYYCFDVNHASSFFRSRRARADFIDKTLK